MAFRSRQRTLEEKFQHDKMLEFKVMSRRNRLLGLWAAGQMGLDDVGAESYARYMVSLTLHPRGAEAAVDHILKSFQEQGVSCSENQVRKQVSYLEQDAERQVTNE